MSLLARRVDESAKWHEICWGGRTLFVTLGFLALFVCACKDRGSGKTAPKVVDGVIDLREWNFEQDGPVRLDGDWEIIPMGSLEADEIRSAPPSSDFVSVPWSEGHHRTRVGRDVDDFEQIQLRVRLNTINPSPGYVLQFSDYLAESFYAECVTVGGSRSVSRAGIEKPASASLFREGLWPLSDLSLPDGGSCAVVVPRAAMNRIRVLASPRVDRADCALSRRVDRLYLVVGNVAIIGTFLAFAATMVAAQRRDTVAWWSLALAALWLVRLFVVNRGVFFRLDRNTGLEAFAWWRLEYIDLFCFVAAVLTYGEVLVERHVRARKLTLGTLIAFAALSFAVPYTLAKTLLPIGQLAILLALGSVLHALFQAARTRALLLARAGIGLATLAGAGDFIAISLTGDHSRVFELLASLEPLFQMAILAVRAQDARRKAADIARATQHFVPAQFLHELGHEDVTTARLGDASSRELTILFSDIRNFTASSEGMTPEETFAFLNGCLSKLGPHVRGNKGFVDKYIGDAIMALFPREPSDAVRAAVAMQNEIRCSNEASGGRAPLAIGVGIHIGRVMMGTIGEAERFEATVISDAVNLTARLESLTKQLGCSVLISEDVYATLDAELRAHTRRLGTFVVKGKAQPVTLYEVFASDSESLRETKLRTRERFDAMLEAFANERVEAALEIAGELRDACPEDGPANWWFMRLMKEFVAADDAVPSSRGIVRLDEK